MASQDFENKWEHFFKPEARSAGRALVLKDVVRISQPSDTETTGMIRVSAGVRVSLKSETIENPCLLATCSCPLSKKSQLCKHVWAVLLQIDRTRPEFLDGKDQIEAVIGVGPRTSAAAPTAYQPKLLSQAQIDSQAAYKAKQDRYRKDQYQKQKARLKEQKLGPKKVSKFAAPEAPPEVKKALHYFSENGFPMEEPLKAELISLAKKKLSTVFHPDKGGAHEEILELNRNCQVLLSYLQK